MPSTKPPNLSKLDGYLEMHNDENRMGFIYKGQFINNTVEPNTPLNCIKHGKGVLVHKWPNSWGVLFDE